MTGYLRQLALLAFLTAFGFVVYLLLFWLDVGSSVGILFYRGVVLAMGAAILTAVATAWLSRGSEDRSLPIAAAALSLSFNICFLVLLPVTVDRSISVYLLSTIEQHQKAGIKPAALQSAFIDGYVLDMGAIDRRIDEQRRSGNIVVTPQGKVQLTAQGKRFMDLSRLVARVFKTDPRFVGTAARKPSA